MLKFNSEVFCLLSANKKENIKSGRAVLGDLKVVILSSNRPIISILGETTLTLKMTLSLLFSRKCVQECI